MANWYLSLARYSFSFLFITYMFTNKIISSDIIPSCFLYNPSIINHCHPLWDSTVTIINVT